jgi:hypothetical protein
MKITIKQSGGYAGQTKTITDLNSAEMDSGMAQKIERIVRDLEFFDLPISVSGGGIGADFFHYEIEISDGSRQHTISFDDDDGPATAPLRKFVNDLIQMK